jgi:hypothetical protein
VITFGENDEDKVIVVVDSEVVTEVESKTWLKYVFPPDLAEEL